MELAIKQYHNSGVWEFKIEETIDNEIRMSVEDVDLCQYLPVYIELDVSGGNLTIKLYDEQYKNIAIKTIALKER